MTEADHVGRAENIIIQLGISALVVLVLGYVGYKIGVLLIQKWAISDAKRTEVYAQGFGQMAASHAAVMKQVNDNHALVLKQVNDNHQHTLGVINAHQADELETIREVHLYLAALDSKVSTAMDLTPVRGIPRVEPSVVLEDNPWERPTPKPRAATGSGIPRAVTEYGPMQSRPVQRPKKG